MKIKLGGIVALGAVVAMALGACSSGAQQGSAPITTFGAPAAPQQQFKDEAAEASWAAAFMPTEKNWAPAGEIVSDSGFRPWPNGFGFENYGNSLATFNEKYGSTAKFEVQPLDSASVQQIFGNAVCASGTGPDCELSMVADIWRQATSDQMVIGHCYGLALTAAKIFNGSINPKSLKTGPSLAFAQPTNLVQQQVNYDAALQIPQMKQAIREAPAEQLNELKTSITRGTLKYTMSLFDTSGSGHVVLPFAITDKGNDLFDIAIWDNNFPNRARAVHVDLNNNTWEYLVSTNPKETPEVWSGNAETKSLVLNPIGSTPNTYPCPFCKGGNSGTLVMSNPVPADDIPKVEITAINGSPLSSDLFSSIPPTSPGLDGLEGLPSVQVAPNTDFGLIFNGERISNQVSTTSQLFANGVAYTVSNLETPVGQKGAIQFLKAKNAVSYRTAGTNAPLLSAAIDMAGVGYGFGVQGDSYVKESPLIMSTARGKFLVGSNKSGKVSLRMERQTKKGTAVWDLATKLPADGVIAVNYAGWTNGNKAPSVKLTNNGKSVSIKASRSK